MLCDESNNKTLSDLQFELPETINLYQIFIDNGMKKEIKHIPKYAYFLHLIYRDQKDTITYVKLCNKLLREVITYNAVLTRLKYKLEELGIIDIDKHYIPKVSCRKYMIKDEYMNGKNLTSYIYYKTPLPLPLKKLGFNESSKNSENIKDKTLNEDLTNKQIQRFEHIRSRITKASKNRMNDLLKNPALPQYRYILNNVIETSVDENVYQYIHQMVNNKTRLMPKRIDIIKDGKRFQVWRKNRFVTQSTADSWMESVKRVHHGIGIPTCSTNTNRLYNSITSYPGELRPFLRHKDSILYYIDIRNSQPFLFLYFVLDDLGGEITDDVKLFIDWVRSGTLYDNLMMEMGIAKESSNLTPDEQWEYDCKRAMFKIDFFGKVFFSNENRLWEQRKVFDKLFPTVSAVITKMKTASYKDLSLRLQKFEASIIIDKVFYRLATLYPDSYCVPIHDAVICEEGMVKIVEDIMIDELNKAVGYKPSLKTIKLELPSVVENGTTVLERA